MYITASKLYNYTQCPHRVWRDVYGPKEEKIKETNPFVQMLWDKGISYEEKVISEIGKYLDLSKGSLEERFKKTIEAMKDKIPLIYQGVLIKDNLRVIPDLLKIMPDGQYVPIDIKSGMGREGADVNFDEEGKLKKHYAIQLALYSDALNRLGFENKKSGIIFDIKGKEVIYDLNSPVSVRDRTTFWELYENTRETVSALLENKIKNSPAIGGICSLCPWYNSCKKWVKKEDDLTGMFYMGRAWRDTINLDLGIRKIDEILNIDVREILELKEKEKKNNKDFLKNIGKSRLDNFIARANILKKTKKPVLYNKVDFPKVSYELFFDIESDPTQEFVYMHGVYERNKGKEKFIDFTAKEMTANAEKRAWADFWKYIKSLPKDDFAVYYYSPFEKTTYRNMQKIYSDVISEKEVEEFFDNPNVIDLYTKVVLKNTDWPLGSYSLKAIAQYLGFKWRDDTPSGALSIQWFNEYLKKKDEKILKRILLYNEDDCKATMVLKDAIQKMSK